MIEINLRPGLKRKRAGGSPLAGLTERFRGLGAKVQDPMLLLAGGAWALALLFLGGAWLLGQGQLAALEPKLEDTRAEHERFRNFVAAKRREEVIRDSVLSQISTIRQVDGERYVWAHVLDEVARALPAYTWLTSVAAQPQVITPSDTAGGAVPRPRTDVLIEGRTVDIQAFTRFLRELEASPWLSGVTALEAETVVEKERAVTAFGIRASFEPADSAYIRTVPLSESVR